MVRAIVVVVDVVVVAVEDGQMHVRTVITGKDPRVPKSRRPVTSRPADLTAAIGQTIDLKDVQTATDPNADLGSRHPAGAAAGTAAVSLSC